MSDKDAEDIMNKTPQAGFANLMLGTGPMGLMFSMMEQGMRTYARNLEQGANMIRAFTPR